MLGVLSAVVVLAAGLLAARLAGAFARRSMMRSPLRKRELLVNFLARTVRVTVIVLAGVMALSQMGVDVLPLIAGVGIAGFVVGFAFKDSLSNLAAGLLLLFYQPFEIGDFVEAAGQTGTVLDMSVAATELKLPDGRLAIVPNSRVWSSHIINFNRLGVRRIDWTVGVAYSADLDVALGALREVVEGDERILEDPAPQLVVDALAESSVDLTVRAWVRPADFGNVMSDVRRGFKEILDTRGVEIPFPHRVLLQSPVTATPAA
jgi:small conductance mechanosensitive channel